MDNMAAQQEDVDSGVMRIGMFSAFPTCPSGNRWHPASASADGVTSSCCAAHVTSAHQGEVLKEGVWGQRGCGA